MVNHVFGKISFLQREGSIPKCTITYSTDVLHPGSSAKASSKIPFLQVHLIFETFQYILGYLRSNSTELQHLLATPTSLAGLESFAQPDSPFAALPLLVSFPLAAVSFPPPAPGKFQICIHFHFSKFKSTCTGCFPIFTFT